MSSSDDTKPAPVLDPDQAAAIGTAPTATATMEPASPGQPAKEDPSTLKSSADKTEEAGQFADKENTTSAAAALDHEAHLHNAPKAQVAPERVTDLKGTQNDVPAPAPGDPDRAIEPELDDLGWSEEPNVPIPVLHGMKNESLWLLVRRFNKQTYRVKALEDHSNRDFDMYISNKEQFQPDKLKATFERIYVNVVVGVVAFIQHITRVRSWSEPKRTAGFMIVYVAAWVLDLLVPTFLVLLLVLILSPRARTILFPAAPLAAIDAKTGQAKVPMAGHLGSKHSLTGAAETFEGEAVEQEASNFVGALGSVALSTAAGKSSNPGAADTDIDGEDEDSSDETSSLKRSSSKPKKDPEDKIPDPTSVAALSSAAQSKAAGEKAGHPDKGDHTKQPMEAAIFASLAPFMHILNNVCDDYERFANALSPTPPFSRWTPRARLAGAILPVFLASLYVNETMIYKGSTFGLGFALFGQPLIDRVKFPAVIAWLDRNVPDWKKYAELRYYLLRGVPTNAQLTVTLLRIGEANKSPLPPPPPAVVAPPPSALHGSDMADHPDLPPEYAEQLADAQADDVASRPAGEDASTTDPKTGKKGSKVLGLLKGVTKAGVETALGVNRVKATTIQSMHAKTKLGVVQSEAMSKKYASDGPVKFKARYRGKRGHVYIVTTAATPSVAFERQGHANPLSAAAAASKGSGGVSAAEQAQRLVQQKGATFAIAIDEIKEIHKVGGLGWKGKLVVGWALGGEVADGIEIVDKQDRVHKLTAMGRRDEVFNRLIALGSQKWEAF